MAKDKRKLAINRQKKLARQKAKAKSRHLHQQQQGVPFEVRYGISRLALQQSPVVGAWVPKSIFESGLGTVIVGRQVGGDEIAAGIYLVDTWCLGVKSAFFRIFSTLEFDDLLADIKEGEDIEKATPEYAAKLIAEAIGYAKQFGLSPHSDFGDAAAVLAGIDATRCTDTFAFRQDGKPLYVSGPKDTWTRSNAIIGQLDAVCGKGNYNFLLGAPSFDDDSEDFITDDELEAGDTQPTASLK